jgi:hypothetical protein
VERHLNLPVVSLDLPVAIFPQPIILLRTCNVYVHWSYKSNKNARIVLMENNFIFNINFEEK